MARDACIWVSVWEICKTLLPVDERGGDANDVVKAGLEH